MFRMIMSGKGKPRSFISNTREEGVTLNDF